MARSKREIPHYYLQHQVDVTECEAFLSRINATRPPDNRLLMGVLLVKAVATAVRRFPAFNGFHQTGNSSRRPASMSGWPLPFAEADLRRQQSMTAISSRSTS